MTYFTRGDYDVYRSKHGDFLITEGGLVLEDCFDSADEAIERVNELCYAMQPTLQTNDGQLYILCPRCQKHWIADHDTFYEHVCIDCAWEATQSLDPSDFFHESYDGEDDYEQCGIAWKEGNAWVYCDYRNYFDEYAPDTDCPWEIDEPFPPDCTYEDIPLEGHDTDCPWSIIQPIMPQWILDMERGGIPF